MKHSNGAVGCFCFQRDAMQQDHRQSALEHIDVLVCVSRVHVTVSYVECP